MKSLVIILLLLSGPACAGWKSVGGDGTATTYADRETLVRSGNTATMWSLRDYGDFQRMVEVGYFSQKAQVEYDCAAMRLRGLSVSLHAEKMGAGKVVYEDTSPHDWEAVDADTMAGILWKVACK